MSSQCNGRKTIQEKVSGKKWAGKGGREKGDGKKSERGGISTMGGEKLAGKGKFSWRDVFFGGKREWLRIFVPLYNL